MVLQTKAKTSKLLNYNQSLCNTVDNNYRIAGIFREGGGWGGAKFNLAYFVEIFSWSRGINHTPIHPRLRRTRRFVDKYFVVEKTTKILPLENYPL